MTRCKNVSDIVKEVDRILFHDLDCLQDKDAEFYFRGESLNFARKNEGTALPLGTSFPCCLDREEAWRKNERELYQEALRLNVISFDGLTLFQRTSGRWAIAVIMSLVNDFIRSRFTFMTRIYPSCPLSRLAQLTSPVPQAN